MFVSKDDRWHQFRAWRKWSFWVFIDEVLSMIRDLIWWIQHFKSTSGFSKGFPYPLLKYSWTLCIQSAKNVQQTLSEPFREHSPKIIFLFDLRINKFFGTDHPQFCPERSYIRTSLCSSHRTPDDRIPDDRIPDDRILSSEGENFQWWNTSK